MSNPRPIIQTVDKSVVLVGVRTIIVPNGTLTGEPGGTAVLDVGSGGSAGSSTITGTAGAILGGNRVVRVDSATGKLIYADNSDVFDVESIVGITVASAVLDAPISVLTSGSMVEPSWTWTAGRMLYLGSTGLLTHTPPSTNTLIEIGVALSATEVLVRIQRSIFLA